CSAARPLDRRRYTRAGGTTRPPVRTAAADDPGAGRLRGQLERVRALALALALVGLDQVEFLQRERDVVQAVEQAVLGVGVDVELGDLLPFGAVPAHLLGL